MTDSPESRPPGPPRGPWDDQSGEGERPFNAPAASVALLALLAAAFAAQLFLLGPDEVVAGALSGEALRAGRWWTLLTYIFLHAGWLHLLMNASAAAAFGPAVARFFGAGPRAASAFLLFFLFCGVAGGLASVAMHWGGRDAVIGASGAISGLWGGAARLMDPGRGLSGPFEGPARGQLGVVVVFNLAIAVLGLAGEAAGVPFRIAWEAHIAGFLAGLLSVGTFARLARPSYRAER